MNDMATAPAERSANQVDVFRHQLDGMNDQFRAALPAHIPVERFARVLMTAVQNNPDLMVKATRRSLWNAAMKSAQDGLLPDGRDGAIVLFGTEAQWMPMIGGIRKKVRNSGEIATWDAHVVHERDAFEYQLGDDPFIRHAPFMDGDPGRVIAAYSVATLKSGEKSREVMSVSEIEKVRAVSRAKGSGPWVTWYEEMCRKTVARRHAKRLPMSTDLDDLIRRDEGLYDFDGAREDAQAERPRSLAGKLDALAAPKADAPAPASEPVSEAQPAPVAEIPETADADAPQSQRPAEPAPAAALAALTPADRKRLDDYHRTLGGALSAASLSKSSAAFWKDAAPELGTRLAEAQGAILGAHMRRVKGETSPADVDNVARQWTAG